MEDTTQITVVLNGDRRTLPAGTGLIDFIASLGLPLQAVLIEHNGQALLRDEVPELHLAEGDQLEILRVVAGG